MISYAPATLVDLPAVVQLAMLVERQHESYMPLRWKLRESLPEGYLRWMTRCIDDPRMFIHVAKDTDFPANSEFSREPKASAGPAQVVGMILVSINDEVPIYTYSEFAYVQDMAVTDSQLLIVNLISRRRATGAREWGVPRKPPWRTRSLTCRWITSTGCGRKNRRPSRRTLTASTNC